MVNKITDAPGGDTASPLCPVCEIRTKYPELSSMIRVILEGVCRFDGKPDILITDGDLSDAVVISRAHDDSTGNSEDKSTGEIVTRPFLPEEILSAVKKIRSAQSELFFADRATLSAVSGDVSIKLTETEFELFSAMLESGSDFISAAELSARAWGKANENNCRVYVTYLRQKLDAAFGDGTVITVRGKGYKLRAR